MHLTQRLNERTPVEWKQNKIVDGKARSRYGAWEFEVLKKDEGWICRPYLKDPTSGCLYISHYAETPEEAFYDALEGSAERLYDLAEQLEDV